MIYISINIKLKTKIATIIISISSFQFQYYAWLLWGTRHKENNSKIRFCCNFSMVSSSIEVPLNALCKLKDKEIIIITHPLTRNIPQKGQTILCPTQNICFCGQSSRNCGILGLGWKGEKNEMGEKIHRQELKMHWIKLNMDHTEPKMEQLWFCTKNTFSFTKVLFAEHRLSEAGWHNLWGYRWT